MKTSEFTFNVLQKMSTELNTQDYWVFASNLTDGIDQPNSAFTKKQFLEQTIFGKKLEETDFAPVIRNNGWSRGTVYPEYSDRLSNETMSHVVTASADGENYYVFRCLSNNYGAESLVEPTPSAHPKIELSDGYLWVYLYTFTAEEHAKYSTDFYVPVFKDTTISEPPGDGIDTIKIINRDTNTGYEELSAVVLSMEAIGGGLRLNLVIDSFSNIVSYYRDRTCYITSDSLSARAYRIINSGITLGQPWIQISNYDENDFAIDSGFVLRIIPTVEIEGDGTGAEAIAELTNGQITNIRVLNSGSGYTKAVARIIRPVAGFNVENNSVLSIPAVLQPVIAPPGGHSNNPVFELGSGAIVCSVSFSDTDVVLPATGSYNSIGLIKNPVLANGETLLDNRLQLELSNTVGLLPGQTVSQSSGFSAVIHDVDYVNNYVYLTGFFTLPATTADNTIPIINTPDLLDDNLPLITPVGSISISAVASPPYTQKTGAVYFIKSFDAINRTDTISESFKIIIEFG